MKVFQCFVFVSFVISVVSGQEYKPPPPPCHNNDTKRTDAFATAIVTALEKLSTKIPPLINFWFDNRSRSCQQEYIFEKLMEKNSGKFLVQTFNYDPSRKSAEEFTTITKDPQTTLMMMKPCWPDLEISNLLLFHSPGMTIEELNKLIDFKVKYFEYPTGRNLKFLIESESKFIDLWSIVHFTTDQRSCRKPQLVRSNRFLINESRWLTNEFQTEPQRNFHGCELRVAVSQGPPYYNFMEHVNRTIEANGLYIDIVKAAAKTFNFSIYFVAIGAKNKQKYSSGSSDLGFYKPQYSDPCTQYLFYNNFIFLIPPGELYSDAEKLFMPLKLEVWIATFVTISIALLTIQIINRMSQQVQDFVFGRNVTTPTLNVMAAFVGGAQPTLPGRNFARFLLMLFIFFSLIIRTCHQSKLFTYLQADIIKSEVESIGELIKQNGLIYMPNNTDITATIQRFEKVIRYDENNPQKIIEKTIEPGFKGAVLTNLTFLTEIESRFKSGQTSLKLLKESEYGYFMKFAKSSN